MNPDVDFVFSPPARPAPARRLLTLAAGLMMMLEFKVYSEIIMTRVTENSSARDWLSARHRRGEDESRALFHLDVLNKTDDAAE